MRTISISIALLMIGGAMASAEETELAKLVAPDAKVEKLAGGMQFVEGPVWMDGFLVFSDIPASKLMKWDGKALSVFRENSNNTNGNTRDREGRLISCEHTARRVTRTDKAGAIEVIVDQFEASKFNSPNDAVVKSDGTIWFTDPTYGLPKGEKKEQPANFFFSYDPATKFIQAYRHNFDQPNGLCFSPDEKRLYVADSAKPRHIRVFEIEQQMTADFLQGDGRPHKVTPVAGRSNVTGGNVFCVIDKGVPDGIRCDEKGNVWSSAGDGVHIFAPDGKLIGKIPVPETPANLCFGGADGKTLFITARASLYSIPTLVAGASRPK